MISEKREVPLIYYLNFWIGGTGDEIKKHAKRTDNEECRVDGSHGHLRGGDDGRVHISGDSEL